MRHAQTEWNALKKAQGHSNVGLNATGMEQAGFLASLAEQLELERILSSDLARCIETATPISHACGIPIESNSKLRERTFGDWEGLSYEDVRARFREVDPLNPERVRPPNGESIRDVWDRIDPVFEELLSTGKSTLIVTHGGTKSLLLAKLLEGTVRTSRSFSFPNCSLTELHRRPDGVFVLQKLGSVEHLSHEEKRESYGVLG